MDTQPLTILLDDILSDVKGAIGCILASTDGVNIAFQVKEGYGGDIDRLSAMVASSFSIGKRMSLENNQKQLQEVITNSSEGYVTLISVGGKAILCCVANKTTILGQLLVKMRVTADKLGSLVEKLTSTD